MSNAVAAAIAAHRFGLGEADLAVVGADATAWLLGQTGPAEPQRGNGLVSGAQGLSRQAEVLQAQRQPAMADAPAPGAAVAAPLRDIAQADVRARLATAAASRQPFNERLALFWANHFTVSLAKAATRGAAGAFEREAIRPHIGGRFVDLLRAAVQHGAMLRYLDNDRSAGPDSAVVRRLARRAGSNPPRLTGLNENLARELLELHTLGAAGGGAADGGWGGYTQADVTALAAVLTGWRVPPPAALAEPGAASAWFDAAWHQPGPKQVLGQRHPEGPEGLESVLQQLAAHPSTARFIATKLARHLVADDPTPALVARLADTFLQTGGNLPAVYRSLVLAPESWVPQPAKLKTPEEFVVSSARLLQLGDGGGGLVQRAPDAGIGALGQRLLAAPSPAGWPDRAEEWLGPDAMWKRVEWATRLADRLGGQIDARALAARSLGPLLTPNTARQIDRAADGRQALALLLLSPDFQRR
ncbi:DUF1800 domain-containing protein [Pseudaquabacterium pictum]|uniref:DUF1800 domain-containing protein n=1 Tax=Pseudaquabacterium pictum TaxID=2315236 RepID=A0A480AY38_9BURK|nr:DUF1800 domain-containing protein [Rubrivivax pictus]GCL65836.1 hypothetical protein AQPW35_49170 [Rubrivivax pictus]